MRLMIPRYRRRLPGFILAAVPLLLASCSGGSGGSETTRLTSELQRNQQLWASRGITSYRFSSYHHSLPAPSLSLEVEVRDGVLVSAVVREMGTNEPVEASHLVTDYGTISRMFETLLRATQNSRDSQLDVEYDAALGYPKSFLTKTKTPGVMDGIGGFSVATFEVLLQGR